MNLIFNRKVKKVKIPKNYQELETIFLTSRAEYMFLSSSIVKQIAVLNGDITNFVPECIHDEIKNRLAGNTGNI